MLPSTGYFKGYNCPFYDGGLCERPYCHFRHVKRDSQSVGDGVESGTILQKLVSAEVKKILQQTEASGSAIAVDTTGVIVDGSSAANVAQSNSKVIYNPTPISELNKINNPDSDSNEDVEQRKRHIPVPYTPRKPVGMPLRRPVETNGSSKPFIYIPPPVKYTPGSAENIQCDAYSPSGGTESNEKYIPGSEKELQEYKPNDTSENISGKRNYIPSDKNDSKKKILEYKPIKVPTKTKLPSVTYQPTPRSLAPCFSSDEDEPDVKKRKICSDLNGLDDLGPEFDILDQILDEEKQEHDDTSDGKTKTENSKPLNNKKDEVKENKDKSKQNKVEHKDHKDKDSHKNSKADKKDSSKDHKSRSQKIDKSTSKDREKDEKSKSSDRKSSHKSSHKDRDKDRSKHKDKNDKEKHSDKSKSKDKHSEKSKSSSKSSDKHSKRSTSKESRSSKSSSKTDNRKSHRNSKDSKEKHKTKKTSARDQSDNDNAAPACEIEDEPYVSESDEEAIALECKKIFEEYVPVEKLKAEEDPPQIEDAPGEEYIPGKKRIARAVESKITRNIPAKRENKQSAAQVMAERLAKVKEFHTTKNSSLPVTGENVPQKLDSVKCPFNVPSSGGTKLRIAHVPYASTLVNAKKLIPPNQNKSNCEASTSTTSTNSTVVQTVKKGVQRIAHVPNEKFIDRPGILEALGSKIPPNIRSKYLNMMIDECLKLYVTATDAYSRAQHEELATSKKCNTVPIYKNSAVLTVSRLRKELLECNGVKKSSSDSSTLPRTSGGKVIESGSWSIENKNRKTIDNHEFTGSKLYNNIQKWILTEEQLQQNGYPRPHQNGEKGRAIIYGQNKQKPPKGLIRTCCRCKKDYSVDKKGVPALKEECIYHPNNKYRMRGEVRYQCCSQDGSSDGCCVAPSHVYEYVDYDNLRGYVKTLPPNTSKDDYGVYSLDCEMCYTTQGLDLTRLTVINSACKVVYETLIKPLHPIIDYNTRFSGITEEQMADVKTSLLEVQATLLTMFSSKTILIGHSLESDFKALKLIHDTVIDTSVLFPHKMGPPYKRALRNLSSEYLKKIIQNSVEGHNSAEDATVCMELIHYKLKEDLKTR